MHCGHWKVRPTENRLGDRDIAALRILESFKSSFLVQRLDDGGCGNQVVGIDSALAVPRTAASFRKVVSSLSVTRVPRILSLRSATRIRGALDAPISRFDMVITFLVLDFPPHLPARRAVLPVAYVIR
ncbi:hypothetical protein MesoLjLa_39560 [Mesorhizobium sp. L-2-11]|nr:hypothetical protein MesoLjLa_39560 [Mesorhizobium sp. L-2-11]